MFWLSFFKKTRRPTVKATKKLVTKVVKKPGGPFEVGTKNGTADAAKNLKAALSTFPVLLEFYHTVKGLYLWKLFRFLEI